MGVLALFRKQIPHSWVSNSTTIQQLNKSLAYRELYLNIAGAPTLTAANNVPTNTARGDEWGVVKRVRILANSSDVLFDMSGDQLWWYNRYAYGNNPPPAVNLGNGTNTGANPTFNSTLIVPFWANRAGKPMDSVFDSGGLTDFRMEVTWGTYTDVNTQASAWTTAPTLTVSSHENELTPAFYPPLIKRVVTQQLVVAGASTNFRFPLDVGPLYRGFLINATTTATPPVDTVGLFTNVRLISGSTIFVDLDEKTLLQAMTLRQDTPFGVESYPIVTNGANISTNGAAYYQTSLRVNPDANSQAWYPLDLVTDGYLSECINTARFNEFYLEFNCSAGCTLNVISQQFLANPRAPQAAASS